MREAPSVSSWENLPAATPPAARATAWTRKALWITFTVYLLVSGYTMSHHELAGDEVHSWNIAKGSATYPELLHNIRYEGHPPVWYTLLWLLSRVTRDVTAMQFLHWAIAALVASLIIFRSPFPVLTRILIPFGYYFLFEYGVLSRNYALGVLLGCAICLTVRNDFRSGAPPYYALLFLMSNCHLLAATLAGGLHLAVLVEMRARQRETSALVRHAIFGVFAILPAVFFIFPSADSALNMESWWQRWSPHQVTAFAQTPLRSFLPLPAWWNDNFWNTQALLEARNTHPPLRFVNPLVSLLLLGTAFYVLRKGKTSTVLFTANLGLSFVLAVTVFPLNSARYSGFLYIGFILAYWLYCAERPVTRVMSTFVNAVLLVQVLGGCFASWKDIRLPFTNLDRIVELIKQVPADARLVTDYWTMNAYSAFVDKPIYCVDMRREMSFILWDRGFAEAYKNPARYSSGFRDLFRRESPNTVYMVSLESPQNLARVDSDLAVAFRVVLIDRREGAIDKGGNLYLYRICPDEGRAPAHEVSR